MLTGWEGRAEEAGDEPIKERAKEDRGSDHPEKTTKELNEYSELCLLKLDVHTHSSVNKTYSPVS